MLAELAWLATPIHAQSSQGNQPRPIFPVKKQTCTADLHAPGDTTRREKMGQVANRVLM
jgi:hypothetical protein